tara:strand:- start:2075 stop:2320 length:246 start_codon:yes stop_codon:yes gene_type:complete
MKNYKEFINEVLTEKSGAEELALETKAKEGGKVDNKMKTIKNIWGNIQKTDIVSIKGVDYTVVNADAKNDRTGSHIVIKLA